VTTSEAHPRPDRRRDRWVSLDGTWEFSFDEATFDRTIVVPFAYQCDRSTVATNAPHEVLWYRRRFIPPERGADERVLVHVGAVDFEATVWVDGTEVGRHRGGHTSFTFDVTAALDPTASSHELVVQAVDEFRSDQLRGKQTATFPFFVHYTPTSGIWQSVWVEVVGPSWIREHHVVAEADGTITIDVDLAGPNGPATVRATVGEDDGALVLEGTGRLTGQLVGARPWSPEDPALYPLTLEVVDADGTSVDVIHGHVGFRTVTVEPGRWLLNGRPLYQRLLLDQGYWPESLITPPSDDAIVADLAFVKDAGFNGVRKHQKIEDPRFLWHADRMGVLVWEELPSSFGLAHVEGALERDAADEWSEAIRRDRNHPCIIAWVPFNESWGVQDLHRVPERQDAVRRMVELTRSLDPTRPVVDNSGWGHVDTDVVDVHDYDQDPARLAARWTGIDTRGWDRGPAIVGDTATTGDDLAASLTRWRAFLGLPEADPAAPDDLRWIGEAMPDSSVWAPGCRPDPGTAGPLVLSEIGGVGLVVGSEPAEVFEYSTAADEIDLLGRFTALVTAVESIPEAAGWCWTQLADVEQEINGLMTTDRRPKVDPAQIRVVLDGLGRTERGRS
jgi:hypothetical protein